MRQPRTGPGPGHGQSGFTLLEVLIAVGILAISMTSLLSSQMAALQATRYAQSLTAISFLAESKLIDVEYELKQDGWGDSDIEYEGDFAEEGWPDVTYVCLVDMIEMPDYTQLQNVADASDDPGGGIGGVNVQDAGEQAFDSLGMVWPIVKGAVERSIRKASCTVYWNEGKVAHDFSVATFWTDPTQLMQLPQTGEVGEDDDTDEPGDGGANPAQPGGGRGGGGPTEGGRNPAVPKGPSSGAKG